MPLTPRELYRLCEHRAWAWWDFWWEEDGRWPDALLPPFFNGLGRKVGLLPLARRLCRWFRRPEGEN